MLKISLLIPFIILLTACATPENNSHHRQIYVFGTLVDVTIWHPNSKKAEQAMDDIDDLFKRMHRQWHAWKPGRLHDINSALRANQSIKLTTDEAHFIAQVIDLSKRSNHHFNPTIGELIHLWGFHTDDYPIKEPPPDKATLQALVKKKINVNSLQLIDDILTADNPHIWLDFGGIAKGLAVDRAISVIQNHGINNAIVNAGGDLRSIGHKGNRHWRIGIQSPTDSGVIAVLDVVGNEAVFTSGNYQRYKTFDGKRYPHIIDGRTGLPVQDIISATVIAADGVTADAAATALIVAGSNQWQQVAAALQLKQVLIINNAHQCFATQAMYRRLQAMNGDCQTVPDIK